MPEVANILGKKTEDLNDEPGGNEKSDTVGTDVGMGRLGAQ